MAIPNPQPQLEVSLDVATGLAQGIFTQSGSTIRWAAGAADGKGGRIYRHLPETSLSKPVESVAKRAASLSPKVYVPLAVLGTVGAGTLGWWAKQRSAQKQYVNSVVLAFETSLRAYVSAAQVGVLDEEIVGRLADDLDTLGTLTGDDKKVKISLDVLAPLFKLVMSHTASLATAYGVDLEDLGRGDDGVVVSLGRHLKAQKMILAEAS